MKIKLNEALALVMTAATLVGCATADTAKDKMTSTTASAESKAPYAKPGFYTSLDKDGRLWVFKEGSDEHKAYKEKGKPAKQVRRIGAGPQGQTLISTEMDHINAYLIAKPGFYTSLDKDGRLWVFEEGSDDHKAYKEKGKPAKQVRRIGAGPQGQTLISTDMAHIDAYLAD